MEEIILLYLTLILTVNVFFYFLHFRNWKLKIKIHKYNKKNI